MIRILLLIAGIIALFAWMLIGFASIPKFGFYIIMGIVCLVTWKVLSHLSKTQKEA